MNPTFETVLSALCSRVEAMPAKDFQMVFLLSDEKEARLAGDVLIAHGFSAKLYPENGTTRMYITTPPETDTATEKKLAAALSHAHAMKTIKQSLDTLCQDPGAETPDYSLSLTGLPGYNRTITINLKTPEKPANLPPVAAAPVGAVPKPQASSHSRRKPPTTYDLLSATPEMTRQSWLARRRRSGKPDSIGTRVKLYLQGNMASAGFILVAIILVLIMIFSMFVMSKSFLCPDFATTKKDKNVAWYCQ